MVERTILVDDTKINYEGIFNIKALYDKVNDFFTKKGYLTKEIKSNEVIKKDGRRIESVYEFSKQLGYYEKSIIFVRMYLEGIKDIIIEREGIKENYNQGKITIVVMASIETDFENRWENAPGFFFVRVIFEKYIFKPFITNYPAMVVNDFNKFLAEIKGFLNLNKY